MPERGEPRHENPLDASIQFIKGVGPKVGGLLAKKGIATLEDAIYFLPRAYEDRRRLTPIAELVPKASATVFGRVVANRVTRRGRQMSFEATISDGTGTLVLFWFRAYPSLKEEFAEGEPFIVHGDVDYFGSRPRIAHPDYERAELNAQGKPIATFNFGRVVPIYSETEGLHQKVIRKIVGQALKQSLSHLEDPLPDGLRARLALPGLKESFVSLHYPPEAPDEGKLPPGARRVIFEEFFVLQLGLAMKKRERQLALAPAMNGAGPALERFLAELPFPLTGDQKRAVDEIAGDLAREAPMTRLVQGDVGAGKTVVAFAGAAIAAANGYQTVMMAPTEILAQQHHRAAERWLKPLGIEPLLLVASTSSKREIQDAAASGSAGFVVGTHAVFQQGVKFGRLGLVVVDEQHRFGVDQRNELVKKGSGKVPHLLMMTATPIPRTLSLTIYGDLDLSIIREKPAGRQPVRTSILRDRERPRLYQKIRDTVGRGEQAYVIYPLIEASEKLELKSATEMHARLSKEIFPDLKIALLHGKMKAEEKDRILADFKDRKYQVLISTTVIEVGIDVPNATLMIIEHPERLGLSQLHQLRGRVGRGALSSECILVADQYVSPRLKVMEMTEDGFEIAEEDLKLRGPGEFLGTRQSGLPGFRVGHIVRDATLLSQAREEALQLLSTDPRLESPANAGVRKMVESRWKEKIERLRQG